ncbi:bifunctional 3,4-dihydroxy-2-butanone-4-phosphate synthase/GTP cyclohydrolase II [Rhodococcoides kyotonense]|uniref:Multifunctional fusion protein n=1 Tax=Rhodococcoides kyotonense TaxID=398843 RepID=A0A177YLS5_9NOCA|nr:bifunctional 3,4-dihydroxy-2-butanone-4-phosphate synthase/GTP cyclohydrolase II [Rhodococcus kyotonensis]OAK56210.1 bifunctional 3,4-dihydroxy-2-butanone 4-phosphate synthase/GTP cyclohydrolase II [Rhodococcus kyotonensis]
MNADDRSANFDIALARLRAGRMIIVVDDPDRENEGDLVMAAEFATADQLTFMVRHTTGIVCAPMSDSRADELELPLMVEQNTDPHATAFTVSVDALDAGTGVSARDRAKTLEALASRHTTPKDLRRPGHIFPLRARPGGVRERGGHTEASVDLLRLAGLTEVGVISEIVAPSGAMMRGDELVRFGAEHDLPIVSISELVTRLGSGGTRAASAGVHNRGSADLPTTFGRFTATAYGTTESNVEHLVLTMGEVSAASETRNGVLVRVHSECITGDLAGSLRCDCGHQFRSSLQHIADEGVGVLIYLRGHEGRGIGLGHKLQAYALQERGRDTVDANLDLGLPVDSREYGIAADILSDLSVKRIRLITNNPDKRNALADSGVEVVDRVGSDSRATPENISYLRTKRDRLGHMIELWDQPKIV